MATSVWLCLKIFAAFKFKFLLTFSKRKTLLIILYQKHVLNESTYTVLVSFNIFFRTSLCSLQVEKLIYVEQFRWKAFIFLRQQLCSLLSWKGNVQQISCKVFITTWTNLPDSTEMKPHSAAKEIFSDWPLVCCRSSRIHPKVQLISSMHKFLLSTIFYHCTIAISGLVFGPNLGQEMIMCLLRTIPASEPMFIYGYKRKPRNHFLFAWLT